MASSEFAAAVVVTIVILLGALVLNGIWHMWK